MEHDFSSRFRRLLQWEIRDFKQQRRRRLRKRHLKSQFARAASNFIAVIYLVSFVKCWQIFLELNSNGLHQSSGKEKESCCLVVASSTKREISHFHVVVLQRRQINVQTNVMHVQSCCFVNPNLLHFCRSRCPRRRGCLSFLSGSNGSSEKVAPFPGTKIRSVVPRCRRRVWMRDLTLLR